LERFIFGERIIPFWDREVKEVYNARDYEFGIGDHIKKMAILIINIEIISYFKTVYTYLIQIATKYFFLYLTAFIVTFFIKLNLHLPSNNYF